MREQVNTVVHLFALIFLFVTITCNFIALFITTWWTFDIEGSNDERQYGLLRLCETTNDIEKCSFRDNVFKFEFLTDYKEQKIDIVLILVTIATGFAICVVILTILLFNCRRQQKSWRCGTIWSAVLSLSSGLGQFAALAYNQIQGEELKGYKQGLAVILAWVSATTLTLSGVLFIVITIIPPKWQDGGVVNVRSISNYPISMTGIRNGTSQGHRNNGYDWR